MNDRSRQYFIYAQVIFYFSVAVCLLVRPKGLSADNGISYFGTFLNTVIPYSIGIIGAAYFFYRSAQGTAYPIRQCFIACSILLIGVSITPYTISNFLSWAHIAVSSAVFIIQLLLGIWIVAKSKFSISIVLIWLLMLSFGILSAVYVTHPKGYLLETQLLYQLSFAALILRRSTLKMPGISHTLKARKA